MSSKKKIIFATNNQGKVGEIRQILSDSQFDIVSLKDMGIDVDVEETGATFEENAIIKAEAIMKMTGEMVLADDSGFEVDCLDKAPGIYSARYLGVDTPYDVKNQHIIDLCKDVVGKDRSARFVCAIACAFPSGKTVTTVGVVEGEVAHEPKGENGFGYDPIFYVSELGCTTAELPYERKNEISHRGIALKKMVEILKKEL